MHRFDTTQFLGSLGVAGFRLSKHIAEDLLPEGGGEKSVPAVCLSWR
jgi:hypothetical protein